MPSKNLSREDYVDVSQLRGMSSRNAIIYWMDSTEEEEDNSHNSKITEEVLAQAMQEWKVQQHNEDQVEQAIAENLYEWGIDPNAATCSEREITFFHCAIRTAIKTSVADSSFIDITIEDGQQPLPRHLPTDMKEAVRYVLSEEIKNPLETYRRIHDTISTEYGQNLGFAPYIAITQRGQDCLQKKLKKEYIRINQSKLNPFKRFSSIEMGKKEYYERFFFTTEESIRLAGLVFEAITASYAIHNLNTCCASCNCSESLRWMGGYGTSWKDIVCIKCDSSYEIKSKASNEKIEKVIRYNNIQGGSFKRFHRLRREKEGIEDAKHYLVLVSRAPSEIICASVACPRTAWQVDLAEIDTVLPALRDVSFTRPAGDVVLKSSIKIKEGTRKLWFRIPFVEIDQRGIAREVFDEYYESTI
jgi:hypothetical protein